jgi:hypothetical protein
MLIVIATVAFLALLGLLAYEVHLTPGPHDRKSKGTRR